VEDQTDMAQHRFTRRTWIALAAVLGGGTLPGKCELRARDALVTGSKSWLATTLLDPNLIAGLTGSDTSSNSSDESSP